MNFGIIYHMLFLSEIQDRNISSKLTPCGFEVTDDMVRKNLQKGEILACPTTMELRSQNGLVSGKDWIIPLTPSEVLHRQDVAIDWTVQACRMAQSWGADIIGLGFLLGKIGRRGADVRRRIDVPVTNGDCYLIANTVQILHTVLNDLDLEPAKEKITIFGFPGQIAIHLTEYLLSLGARLILVANSTPFMNKVLKKIVRKGNSAPELVPSISEASRKSRFFLTAGSEDQRIHVHEFPEPAIVLDVSFPKNVPQAADHVFVIDSGIVEVPKASLNITGYYPDKALTCLSELMMLSLEGHKADFSMGKEITLDKINQVAAWASKYGFNSDQLLACF
jgi:fatty aldehyde-generating acyl-ACP reductase